jgi:cytochrome c oxidase cbb3-type subunit 2
MLSKADNSATFAVVAALVLFFIGGILTTVVPPLVDKSWARPFENNDPAKGPTGKLLPLNEQQLHGRAIYVREGCWYCHTQQTRTLLADTKRTGPDLSRVGGKYDTQWHRTHLRNPRDLVPGSVMPPFPWIVNDETEFKSLVAYLQTLGRAKNWRPDNDYER